MSEHLPEIVRTPPPPIPPQPEQDRGLPREEGDWDSDGWERQEPIPALQ